MLPAGCEKEKKKHSPLLRALNHLITLESGRWRHVHECLVCTMLSGRSHLGIMEREQFCPRLSLNAEVGLSASPLLFFFLPQIGGNILANLRLLIKCGRRLKWHPRLGGKIIKGGLCFKKNPSDFIIGMSELLVLSHLDCSERSELCVRDPVDVSTPVYGRFPLTACANLLFKAVGCRVDSFYRGRQVIHNFDLLHTIEAAGVIFVCLVEEVVLN